MTETPLTWLKVPTDGVYEMSHPESFDDLVSRNGRDFVFSVNLG
jgi:hypothetical protein